MKEQKKPERVVVTMARVLRPNFRNPERLKAHFKPEPRYAEFGGLNEEAVAAIHRLIDDRAAMFRSKPVRAKSRRRRPGHQGPPPFIVSFPSMSAAVDFGSNLALKVGAQLQTEEEFRGANRYFEDMSQQIRELWVEHDILDAELGRGEPGMGAVLLVAQGTDGRHTLRLLTRKTELVSAECSAE
jgi:hypothetical protein